MPQNVSETKKPSLALFSRAAENAARTAVRDSSGTYTYGELLHGSAGIAAALLDGARDLGEARVAFLVSPGFDHVCVQWAIWRAGGVAVPLCSAYPAAELEYQIDDADVGIVVAEGESSKTLGEIARRGGRRFLTLDELRTPDAVSIDLPSLDPARRAMILYTSGTTSRPKGVVSTHAGMQAQIEMLVGAWEWESADRILHVLPLHHVHGIVNVLLCALWSGATCDFLPRFDAQEVWKSFVTKPLTLFMAVPTIYVKLISAWEAAEPTTRREWSEACSKMRLMVSGSAALPVSVLERWLEISGHVLLERYGMTEVGMALSNPLRGERRAGSVGMPLPGVEIQLLDDEGEPVVDGDSGEIHVRGPAVFQEYWQRAEATREAFRGRWFRTGDVAVLEDGSYRILGRNSVDIIKTGGYKVSALEIEEVLRTHPDIQECAVVGLPDDEWGERVACAVVCRESSSLNVDALRSWARDRIAPYKIPTRLVKIGSLPRNALGKVTKPVVVELFKNAN